MGVLFSSPRVLSGSTDGRPIKVAATSTPGTLLHTGVAGTDDLDHVTLYATNTSATPVKLTLEWGGTTSPDDLVEVYVRGESGLELVADRVPIRNGLVVRAFGDTTNVVNVVGWFTRTVDETA